MPLQISGPYCDSIPASDLREGQIAVIVHWEHVRYLGYIVQRRGTEIHILGPGRPDKFCAISELKTNRVRVLPNGTTLTITDNE